MRTLRQAPEPSTGLFDDRAWWSSGPKAKTRLGGDLSATWIFACHSGVLGLVSVSDRPFELKGIVCLRGGGLRGGRSGFIRFEPTPENVLQAMRWLHDRNGVEWPAGALQPVMSGAFAPAPTVIDGIRHDRIFIDDVEAVSSSAMERARKAWGTDR